MSTVKTLIVVDVKQGWPMFQLDVNNAFLHGDLDEEVFMKLPPSVGTSSSSVPLVCRLRKSLYGLRQASKQWYAKLSQALHSRGYTHSLNDYSLFTRGSGKSMVILIVYVDDIILTGTDEFEIASLKEFLNLQFKIKDLGSLNYFLGIEVLHTPSGVLLHQKKFIHDLLANFNSSDCSPVTCHPELNVKLKAREGDPLPNPETYRSFIGKLNFLTHTRPDLSFAVQHLSQFIQQPCFPHMKVALHLLRYLKGTSDFGLFFSNSPDLSLQAYCASDWGSCLDSRRSISGFYIFLGGSLIGWKSKKQVVVSLSSVEAEYRSMSKVMAGITWVCRLLSNFWVSSASPVPLYCDSISAIHIARNPIFHERTKYIELDCHFVRSKLTEGLISLSHTSSTSQLADVFTKPLCGPSHHLHIRKLGVLSPSNLRGAVEIG
uniref:Uncharacterized mitochondrial protein AtMg00810-like n=1 Tax=Nicotiana tabacum TaxID=4097 RepID=A0A1S3XQL3_TOBAC|nr:PREDICTED: uncharacterized mitochondrial protein AtMg00810-like [Nicotiana tabacum]